MSLIRNMDTRTLVTMEGRFCTDPQPGDMVRYYLNPHATGVIIKKLDENQSRVLWGTNPEIILTQSRITLPGKMSYVSVDLVVEK